MARSFAKDLNKLIRLTTVPGGRCSSCPPFIDEGGGAQRSGEACPSHLVGEESGVGLLQDRFFTMTLQYLPTKGLFLKVSFYCSLLTKEKIF